MAYSWIQITARLVFELKRRKLSGVQLHPLWRCSHHKTRTKCKVNLNSLKLWKHPGSEGQGEGCQAALAQKKGRGGNLRRELIALQHCLQVHQSPCKLKARWGSGFTGPIWHQTHITLRWGHHPYREDALGTLIPPTSASRRGPHYLRQQKEEPLCAISTILYILNSATFSTKVHFN